MSPELTDPGISTAAPENPLQRAIPLPYVVVLALLGGGLGAAGGTGFDLFGVGQLHARLASIENSVDGIETSVIGLEHRLDMFEVVCGCPSTPGRYRDE